MLGMRTEYDPFTEGIEMAKRFKALGLGRVFDCPTTMADHATRLGGEDFAQGFVNEMDDWKA